MTNVPAIAQERSLRTDLPGPASRELTARKNAAVARGVGTTMPVFADQADRGILRDVDGNCFVDLGAGIAVTSVGAAAPRVVAAVRDQLEHFTHTCFMVTPYEGYVAVCEKLNELTPGEFEKKSALFSSGAEAVENAVKVARAYTRRPAVVVLDHAYHGRTNLTMAMTGKVVPYKDGFGPFSPEVYRVPGSYPLRDGLSGEQAAARTIEQITRMVGPSNTACVVIEPIQGEGGFIVPADGFLPAVARWCSDNDVVFVADEIQTGFARTGAWFASQLFGIVPDVVTTAKGMAGGLPLSAVTGRADIMDAAGVSGLGGTYGGNPLACAAALAAIETYEADGLVERAQAIGEVLMTRLRAATESDPRIGDVRGRGAMVAMELVDPGTGDPDAPLANQVAGLARSRGVITLTCGTYGNVLRFLPPLTIDDTLLADGVDTVLAALTETGSAL
ncbi:MAG: 4-aminobutyrate--2-oxoglutarate transaminase [Micrococcales bacterium]|nr:4-aminobutyrate--2-oxoglutarate transaminase [Micrococcales bacterium]MCL2668663.1 4-aminobutyrate--2-oxoglutarate transaminase [Micrococcales bacterium]